MVDTRLVKLILHQIVMDNFMILFDVAPLLCPLPPTRWRPEGELYHYINHSFMQHIEYFVFGRLNVRVRGRYGDNDLVEWNESERSVIWSGKKIIRVRGVNELPDSSIYRLDSISFNFLFLKFKMVWTNQELSRGNMRSILTRSLVCDLVSTSPVSTWS
jgi:hypothetical protein